MAYCRVLIWLCIYLTLVLTAIRADEELCDIRNCDIPVVHYYDLGCEPVYGNNSCCPERYNCDHLNNRNISKCYVNGQEYEIGETMREEDANPCDKNCTCVLWDATSGFANFNCSSLDEMCPAMQRHKKAPKGVPKGFSYFRRNSPEKCCSGEEVSVTKPEDYYICDVNGKIYIEGDIFPVNGKRNLRCICKPGYKGKNIEPFCVKVNRWTGSSLNAAMGFYSNCAPIYTYESILHGPRKDWRCQGDNDFIIPYKSRFYSSKINDDKNICRFGNMTMYLGEKLNDDYRMGANFELFCIRCVCRVPPVPTCYFEPNSYCKREDGLLKKNYNQYKITH